MRIDHKIEDYVKQRFPQFGINKKIQVVRLLFEIAKREQCEFSEILSGKTFHHFEDVKRFLLARRYPTTDEKKRKEIKLNALNLDPRLKKNVSGCLNFSPQRIFVEKGVEDSEVARNLQKAFPSADIEIMDTYKDYVARHRFTIHDYNRRAEKIFVIKEPFDFVQPCPCSKGSVRCGYANFKLGYGCPFECSYCFLQSYTNAPGIILPANLNDFFAYFESTGKDWRIGSGQFTDSLVFDHLTRFSPQIVRFFEKHPDSLFEFKTKSDNVDLLCQTAPARNVIVSWSLNPQSRIDKEEFFTASLDQRLRAAEKCVSHGYSVGFHFDPIFYFDGWKKEYQNVVEQVFLRIDPQQIKWISLGCLRMTPHQKQVIETRFPENEMLDAELILDCDQKLRYAHETRKEIFSFMKEYIHSYSKDVRVYLCMESSDIHDALGMPQTAF